MIEDTSVQTLQLLERSRLLQGLSPADLSAVARSARSRAVERGGFFFQQGEAAQALYVLTLGQVRVAQTTPEGHQTLLRFLGPAEMLGAIAVLGQDVYPATAEAVVDCRALAWDAETMTRLMERFPHLALNALYLLATQIRELQERYQALTSERVERRVARALVRLADHAGQKVEGGVLINLPLSRQDLAEMTGTTLFTVSRILSRWEHAGLVESGRERILVRRPHGLVAIAEDLAPSGKPEGPPH
jgi:CRP/FNR family transcriptional regulator, nitrogen oxide reductase regulator